TGEQPAVLVQAKPDNAAVVRRVEDVFDVGKSLTLGDTDHRQAGDLAGLDKEQRRGLPTGQAHAPCPGFEGRPRPRPSCDVAAKTPPLRRRRCSRARAVIVTSTTTTAAAMMMR